jgi:5'-deoxynucleotidase YfbR-like HD superfamily hydrolase
MRRVDCGCSMTTFSGKYINPAALQPGDICIEDIAQGLSNMTRFAGQCRDFYSVAQHSAAMATEVLHDCAIQGMKEKPAREMARIALLHDAPEAYCSDLVRCVKKLVGASYKNVEYSLWVGVVEHFRLEPLFTMLQEGEDISELPAIVHNADMCMLVTERRDLISEQSAVWDLQQTHQPYTFSIEPMPPRVARGYFMHVFQELFL